LPKGKENSMSCKEFEGSLSLYPYDELAPEERQALEAHLAGCAACRKHLEETERLHQQLAKWPVAEATPQLLARCRMELDEALDHEVSPGWRNLFERWFVGFGSALPSRAAVALSLVVLGFGLGWEIRPRLGSAPPAGPGGTVVADLGNLHINNISQVPASRENGPVRISVDADHHMTLEGSLDDPRIRQVLVDALKDYNNPGIRHDSLDVLRSNPGNPSVRGAFLSAMQNDPDAGMRLDALQAAEELDWTPEVRQAFLNTLEKDKNPGVRVAAVDVLTEHADDSLLPAFERLAASDPNRYVRMKSLSTLRKLNGGQN
jgi:putative zinc finger protein/HEAT repeat protein